MSVDRVNSGALRQEALRAALASREQAVSGGRDAASNPSQAFDSALQRLETLRAELRGATEGGPAPADRVDGAADPLRRGLSGLDAELQAADSLAADVVSGKVTDFHEVAATVKRADLSLRYALEIRNRLIDAYREVMRMSV